MRQAINKFLSLYPLPLPRASDDCNCGGVLSLCPLSLHCLTIRDSMADGGDIKPAQQTISVTLKDQDGSILTFKVGGAGVFLGGPGLWEGRGITATDSHALPLPYDFPSSPHFVLRQPLSTPVNTHATPKQVKRGTKVEKILKAFADKKGGAVGSYR